MIQQSEVSSQRTHQTAVSPDQRPSGSAAESLSQAACAESTAESGGLEATEPEPAPTQQESIAALPAPAEPVVVHDDAPTDSVSLVIKQTNDEPITVELQLDDSVATLKALVAEQTSVPAQAQRLLYRARVLDEGHTLRHYNNVQ